jgi:hypothetical protein
MGLIELLFLAAFGWVIVNGVRRLTGPRKPGGNASDRPDQPAQRSIGTGAPPERSVTTAFDARFPQEVSSAAPPAQQPLKLSPEQRMAELKRRYIADEITVEEYEAELDKLIRPGDKNL